MSYFNHWQANSDLQCKRKIVNFEVSINTSISVRRSLKFRYRDTPHGWETRTHIDLLLDKSVGLMYGIFHSPYEGVAKPIKFSVDFELELGANPGWL